MNHSTTETSFRDTEQYDSFVLAAAQRRERAMRRRLRTNRMLVWMVVAFALSMLPFVALNLLRDVNGQPEFVKRRAYLFGLATHWVAMTSTAWNPLLYAWLNKQMRHAFVDALPGAVGRAAGWTSIRRRRETTYASAVDPNWFDEEGRTSSTRQSLRRAANFFRRLSTTAMKRQESHTSRSSAPAAPSVFDCQGGSVRTSLPADASRVVDSDGARGDGKSLLKPMPEMEKVRRTVSFKERSDSIEREATSSRRESAARALARTAQSRRRPPTENDKLLESCQSDSIIVIKTVV